MSKKDIFMKEYLPYIIVIIIVLLIKAFIVTPIRVNGPSMLDTLEDKDIMILDEVSFKFKGLKRFDIVVIKDLDLRPSISLVSFSIFCSLLVFLWSI